MLSLPKHLAEGVVASFSTGTLGRKYWNVSRVYNPAEARRRGGD